MAPLPPCPPKNATHTLKSLQVRTPIQVGGGSLPEGGILPAQIGGVPVIPGSSGARCPAKAGSTPSGPPSPTTNKPSGKPSCRLTTAVGSPAKSRFGDHLAQRSQTLSPPSPSKKWQLFDEKKQTAGRPVAGFPQPQHPVNPDKFVLQVQLPQTPTPEQKAWLDNRLKEMLLQQGIGRGTRLRLWAAF